MKNVLQINFEATKLQISGSHISSYGVFKKILSETCEMTYDQNPTKTSIIHMLMILASAVNSALVM